MGFALAKLRHFLSQSISYVKSFGTRSIQKFKRIRIGSFFLKPDLHCIMAAPASSHEDLVAYDDSDAEAEVAEWPARHALAAVWEESFTIRQSLRKNGKMLKWPKAELTGTV